MTEQIKNLFKHDASLHLRWHYLLGEGGMYLQDRLRYETILIKYPPAIGIENSDDVYEKVKPFLRHLASKHIAEKREGYTYTGTEFDTGIRFEFEEYYMDHDEMLVEVNIEPENTINGIVFKFREPDFKEFDPYDTYSYPKKIYVVARVWYRRNEVESEDESENESITLKSYKEDKCMVCLANKPELLFYDCGHYCVCHECEERKPFKNCPFCRTCILTKIII